MSSEGTDTSSQSRFDRLAVADVMTMDPVTVGVDATLEVAEQLLAAYRISGLPVVGGYLSLFTGRRVDVIVRVRRKDTGKVLYQEVLFPDEDMDTDAEGVEIDWKADGSVKFDYERRKQNRRFWPPP